MLLSSFSGGVLLEAGCDEAGRGCLAGPVFAAAVILPKDYLNEQLNDSKKLSEKQRDALRIVIERDAIAFHVAQVSTQRIDEINILNASFEAMNIAIANLSIIPELLLIDGNRFRTQSNIPYRCVVKGDGKYMSIAAASILAKTHRDEYMRQLDEQYPLYQWKQNKGYPTKAHREALLINGQVEHHRKTFHF